MQKDQSPSSLTIIRTDSRHPDFVDLVRLLDAELVERDGEEYSFYAQFNKLDSIKYVVLVYDNDRPVGCGALKHFGPNEMEIKRMYVPPSERKKGIASRILVELESWAREMFCTRLVLETGKRQFEAVGLYQKNGYTLMPNYDQYVGMQSSVCFEKTIS